MKKVILIILAAIVVGGVYYWSNVDDSGSSERRYTDSTLPLSFEAIEDYVITERAPDAGSQDHIKTIILMQKDDYDSVQRGEREGGEGPPVISMQIYRNPLNLSPRSWVEQNAQLSNFSLLRGNISETKISAFPAVVYDADGLYANRNAVISSDDRIYHVSGSYIDRDSAIYRDYDRVIRSLGIEN